MVEQKDRFGELIGDALRDEAARCHLPSDFTRRLLHGRARCPQRAAEGLPRWLKVAAMVAAMASFVALAAVVGRVVLNAPESNETSSIPSDPETEIISNQGENTMIARKMATLVGAAMVSVAVPAETIESEPTFVFLRPETSSFWNTATNNTMTVPIDYPAGAASAELSVRGVGYQCVYKDITTAEYAFDLPAAVSPETENVYDLTLSFFNAIGEPVAEPRTARLGLIQGLSPDAEGTTRCLAPSGSKVWNRVKGQAVLPIPYGMRTITVNGVDTDTGLDGAQGWYALGKIEPNETVTLSGAAGGVEYAASLLGGGAGLMMILK